VEILRIISLLVFDGQIRLDPGSSGAISVRRFEISDALAPENSGDLYDNLIRPGQPVQARTYERAAACSLI
jgi:hypothetical protein